MSESRVPGTFTDLAACVPGSSTAFASVTAVPEFRRALSTLSAFYSEIAEAVTNAAGEFERDDEEIAQGIREAAQPR